ncbi:hypothetical protein CSC70_00365 [Pseudoxanthomonas kalamensis DSM 18571]|uniref:hypothetical protein n=1 Tax=Pseudoxanthomonas kalamensis TaxID=289483 RepID=UPI001390BCF7|nr:hypothetical protein [Pseudoxanthomonas kalamensis]KAF1712645.1 hypothetical protein CSC70_00365 [Pseudoxanthomonas kalamensis DSM 18571]
MKRQLVILALASVLAACGPSEADLRAAAEAAAAQKEQAAAELAKQYEDARVAQKWEMARIHGAALLAQYPDTQAATEIQQSFDEVKGKAEAQREQDRLSSLWNYSQVADGGGIQRSALIYSQETVDVDGSGPRTVQLVFRDHPKWKRSSYLVLQAGDFAKACYRRCTVTVTTDDGKSRRMSANRPDTDEAIAMFIDDEKALWKLARNNKALAIEFQTRDVGAREVVFETGGLNPTHMPGWD